LDLSKTTQDIYERTVRIANLRNV